VEEGERPDFVLWRTERSQPFGAEITEFYHSEAAARLRKVPDYVSRLLSGGPPLHKDDRSAFTVDDVTITGPDGTFKAKTKAIIEKLPVLSDYTAMVAETIKEKSDALADYRADLSHTNLIISDDSRGLSTVGVEHFATLMLSDLVRGAISASGFREIHFLTAMRGNKEVYFPLKQLILLRDLFLFKGALVEFAKEHARVLLSEPDEMFLYAWHLQWLGFHPTLLTTPRGSEVLLGNSGALVENEGVVVHDYTDDAMPTGTEPLPPSPDFQRLFPEAYSNFVANHMFTSGLAYSAITKAPITPANNEPWGAV